MKAANQVVSFGKQLFSIRYVYSGSDFKPCSHEGSDPQKWYKNNSQRVSIHVPIMGATTEIAQICPLVRVSIHAPTKGALMSPTLRISCSFNPRSHEGSDSAINVDKAEVSMFQSTLPRRERLFVWARIKGDDGVSIHAPTKGATCIIIISLFISLFQSTLPRRERLPGYAEAKADKSFNPRSHEGSDYSAIL